METIEKKATFKLPNKKVKVVPIKRKGAWLPNNHEASILFKESSITLVVKKGSNGRLLDPLTPEERDFFEDRTRSGLSFSAGDLNIHRDKDENYWLSKAARIKLNKYIRVLDLSDPKDYLEYKILLTNTDLIAPSEDEKFGKRSYKFCIVDEDVVIDNKAETTFKKMDAYKALGKMEDSPEKMINFLRIWNHDKPGTSVTPDSKREWLITEIGKIVETEPKKFLSLYNDKDYDHKVMAQNALLAKAITRKKNNYYLPEDPNPIASNLADLVEWIKEDVNQEEVLRIKARIDNSKF